MIALGALLAVGLLGFLAVWLTGTEGQGAGGGQEQVLGYSSCDCLNNTGVLPVGLLYDVMRSAGKSVASAWLRTYSHHDCGLRLQLLLLHADGWHTCLLPCCFLGRTKALPPGPIVPLQHVTHAAGNPHVFLEVEAGLESRSSPCGH